jgi:enoyl-CoA hydratase/carnithine racemase
MTDTERVRIERDGAVLVATLARPERRNALDDALVDAIKEAVLAAEADPSVNLILLEADGPDFCAGADLEQTIRNATTNGPLENLADAARLGDLFIRIRRLGKVVIAAVHGRALAGGAGLSLACDLVLAADTAEFGYPEVRHGLVPAMVGGILRRSVGEKIGFELLARGGRFTAMEALRLGLANRVFPADRFRDEARAYAREIAALSASALRLTKRLFYGQDNLSFEDAIGRGAEINVLARSTEDAKKGIERFLAPRP